MPEAQCHGARALDPWLLSDTQDTSPLPLAARTSPMQTVVITYLPQLQSPPVVIQTGNGNIEIKIVSWQE